jgi:hypothetical protein
VCVDHSAQALGESECLLVTPRTPPLQTLLHALEQPDSCFVLGAGTSTPIVPLAAQLSVHVRARLLSVGSFPASPIVRDPISDRILSSVRARVDRSDGGSEILDELIARHLSPAAIHAATVAVLRPQAPLVAPPQYVVFGMSRYPLSLLNFNNDGLASRYCSEHNVINLHGTSLSVERRTSLGWESLTDTLQEFPDLPPLSIPGLLLPQTEPLEIVRTPQFRAAQMALLTARRLILVGYSFGEMDDRVAYAMIMSTMRTRRIDTVVAKPDPLDLAVRMAEDSGNRNVVSLPAYWDSLSRAIIASVAQPQRKSCNHARLCARCVAYLYEAFLDGR